MKNENPSIDEIEKLHGEYLKGLKDLYDEFNPVYGDSKVALNFT